MQILSASLLFQNELKVCIKHIFLKQESITFITFSSGETASIFKVPKVKRGWGQGRRLRVGAVPKGLTWGPGASSEASTGPVSLLSKVSTRWMISRIRLRNPSRSEGRMNSLYTCQGITGGGVTSGPQLLLPLSPLLVFSSHTFTPVLLSIASQKQVVTEYLLWSRDCVLSGKVQPRQDAWTHAPTSLCTPRSTPLPTVWRPLPCLHSRGQLTNAPGG